MRTIAEVLVVDPSDEDAVATLVSLRTTAPDATVFRLTDGEQALHFIGATDGFAARPTGLPRLILLEVYMPGMDGIAVLKSLRARPGMEELPVVVWTSSSNPLLIEQALQAGASEYHVKPAALDAYRAALDKIARRWVPKAMASDASVSRSA